MSPKILAFTGSLRANSYSGRALQTIVRAARAAGAEVNAIDLKDFPMPIYNADLQAAEGFPETAARLQKILLAHDGLIVASPEYNASLPGGLKNMIDWTSRANGEIKLAECFKGKTAAIVTVSPGNFGGIRCLSHLRDVLTLLLVNVLPTEIALPRVNELFDGDRAEMKDGATKTILENLGASLVERLNKMSGDAQTLKSAS